MYNTMAGYNNQLKPSAELQACLDKLSLYKKRTIRGCRAGRDKQRQINVVNSHHRYQPSYNTIERGVNFDNLVKIQPTSCLPRSITTPIIRE